MKCFGLDNNGDLFLENGNLKIYEKEEAIAQVAMNVVYTLKGEVVLDSTRGIPYFNILFNNNPNIALLKYYISLLVSKVKGVKNIISIKAIKDKNLIKYTLLLDTDYGKVEAHD